MLLLQYRSLRRRFNRRRLLLNQWGRPVGRGRSVGAFPLFRGREPIPTRYPFHYTSRTGQFQFRRKVQLRIERRNRTFDSPFFSSSRTPLSGEKILFNYPYRLKLRSRFPSSITPAPIPPMGLSARVRGRIRLIRPWWKRGRFKLKRRFRKRSGWVGRWLGLRVFISKRRSFFEKLPRRRRRRQFRTRKALFRYRAFFRVLIRLLRSVRNSPLLPRTTIPLFLFLLRRISSFRFRRLSLKKRVRVARLLKVATSLFRFKGVIGSLPYTLFRLRKGHLRYRSPLTPPSSFSSLLSPPASLGLVGSAFRFQRRLVRLPMETRKRQRTRKGRPKIPPPLVQGPLLCPPKKVGKVSLTVPWIATPPPPRRRTSTPSVWIVRPLHAPT